VVRIWAVANQKGGVGKSTSVIALGGLLAQQGKRVLLADLDPQGSLTGYFNYDPDTIEGSIFDLFTEDGEVPNDLPAQLLRETSCPNLFLLPASTAQATVERRMASSGGMGLVLSQALALLADDFDYVLLDNAPSLGVLMVNSMAASHQLLIPVQTEFLAMKGLERMMTTLPMVEKARQKPLPYTIIATMFDRRTQASIQSYRALQELYGKSVFSIPIPVDTKFRGASLEGLVPSMYDKHTHGVKAYARLLAHLLERDQQQTDSP
jgi:chromosome partitioning protein